MIKNRNVQQNERPIQQTPIPTPIKASPGDIVIGNGKNILKKYIHGGNLGVALFSLSESLKEANDAGYLFKQTIVINSGESILVFERIDK